MIGKFFSRSAEAAPMLLRLTLGIVFAFHGAQKLFGAFDGPGLENTSAYLKGLGIPAPGLMAVLLGLGEFGSGILLLLGLLTRYAALVVMFIMVVAIFAQHWEAGFDGRKGGFEYPFTLFMMSFALLFSGGGKMSVDRAVKIDDRV